MQISAGTRLGQYEIVARLGAGGMGEVYRARDTRLGRDVALKALSGELSQDPQRLVRFEAEARSASALNHPNIVTIHEIGRDAATPFIVMELVEGRTLRNLLHAGPLPLRRALDLSAQLADALALAHEAGIVHRDLKPENVMVTRDGFAKILDFGLAKIEPREGRGEGSAREDLTLTETRDGAVVGTAGYMSPEQASGQSVDFRSDQFAFGALLFEMLSGRRAFQRPTRAETLAAIIRDEPEPLSVLMPRTPVPVLWVVERCLAKPPDERYGSTRDLARDLKSVRDHFSQIDSGADGAPLLLRPEPRRARRALSWAVAVGLAALVASAYLLGTSARAPSLPSFHRLTFRDGTIWAARFAPDGRTVVYGAAWNGDAIRTYSTRPENPESSELALPPASLLSVSSGGELAILLGARPSGPFSTTGTLARAPLAGGGPREVLEDVQAADFSPDGASFAVLRTVRGRHRLEYPPGHTLYETSSGYLTHARFSPDGELIAFLEHPMRGDDAGEVAVVDRSGKRRTLSAGWMTARGLAWSADGSEVWFTAAAAGGARSLHAVTLSGQRRLVARVPGALTLHDLSREGRALVAEEHSREGMVALAPPEQHPRDLSWHDWTRAVDLTADGTTVLFDETGEGGGASYAVYVRRTDGSPAVRLGEGHALALSPDGRWALAAPHATPAELVLLPTGAGEPRRLATGRFDHIQRAAWLPGADGLVLAASEAGMGMRLYVQPAAGGVPRALTPQGIGADWAVSPDGGAIVAVSPDRRLLRYPIAAGAEPEPVAGAAPGDAPIRYSPDGRTLFVLARPEGASSLIARLDAATGERSAWKEISAGAAAGVPGVSRIFLSADGETYVYSYVRLLDELFLVDGLR